MGRPKAGEKSPVTQLRDDPLFRAALAECDGKAAPAYRLYQERGGVIELSDDAVRRSARMLHGPGTPGVELQGESPLPVPDDYADVYRHFLRLCERTSPHDLERAISGDVSHMVDTDRKAAKARADLRDLRRRYKHLHTERDEQDAREELWFDLQSSDVSPVAFERTEEADDAGIAHFVWSDWHIEERVDRGVMDGMNEQTPEISQERNYHMVRNGLKRIKKHRRDLAIDTLVVWAIGDFVTGYIHDELVEDNFLSPTEATLLAGQMLQSNFRYLLDEGEFKRIIVATCRGNHGRTDKYRKIATEHKNSFEWLLYNHLARQFEGDDRIEFVIPKSREVYVECFDMTIRGHHGDAFRGGGGIGGIMPPLFKWLHRANDQRHADHTFIGHWHQMISPHRTVDVNGSMIGLNAYAKEIGCYPERPAQLLRIQSARRGMTTHEPIFCE